MRKLIRASNLQGTIKAPASKSCMQRLILASLISKSKCNIYNIPYSKDVTSAIILAQSLGLNITLNEDYLQIEPTNYINKENLNCGESATALRMFLPYAIHLLNNFEINGHGTILKRSFYDIEENLKKLNININTKSSRLPFSINGKLKPGVYRLDGSHSSQLISGLLMAMPLLEQDTILHVSNQVSKPYIDLTLKILESFGISIEVINYKKYYISGNQEYQSRSEYTADGDWSSAANLLVAGAICGDLEITGLKNQSFQADKVIIDILEKCGAKITVNDETVKVSKSDLAPFEFNANDSPDLVPALVALAVNCKGISRISGIKRLENKESNRTKALIEEYSKMRANIRLEEDTIIIEGGKVYGSRLWSHSDHRIVMSLAIAALNASGLTELNEVSCVSKSYGNFFSDLEKLGAKII